MTKYKSYTLAKNSHAYFLYEMSIKDPEYLSLLDRHLKQLEADEKALLAKYK